MQTVVFFDMDGTLVKGNVNTTIIWHLWRMHFGTGLLLIQGGFWFILWKLGVSRDSHSMAKKGAGEFAGISRGQMDNALDTIFQKYIHRKIFQEGLDIIQKHKEKGHEVILLSSSFEPFVRRIADFLKIERIIATQLGVEGDRYTGTIDGDVVGGRKHRIVAKFRKDYAPDEVFAYTDHHQDIPLLQMVTHPIVVNPTLTLRRFAKQKGWRILQFSKLLGDSQI